MNTNSTTCALQFSADQAMKFSTPVLLR